MNWRELISWYTDRVQRLAAVVTEYFTPLAHERIKRGHDERVRRAWRRRHDERRHGSLAALTRRNRIAMQKASRRRNRAACIVFALVLLSGCAGPFGLSGSPEQLKELIKVKDAAVTCVKGVYAGMTVTATAGSIDKGIYGGTVTVDENCKMTVGTGPWAPGQPVSPPTPTK